MLVHQTPLFRVLDQLSQVDVGTPQYPLLLKQLIPLSDHVNYDLDALGIYQRILTNKIEEYARRFSPIYHGHRGRTQTSKEDLRNNQKSWFTNRVKAIPNETSGSTEPPLRYEIWDAILLLERHMHYNLIAKEFAVPSKAKIAKIHSSKTYADWSLPPNRPGNVERGTFIDEMWVEKSALPPTYMNDFGIDDTDITVLGMPIDISDMDRFCRPFFEWVLQNDIDIVTGAGSITRILAEWLRNHDTSPTKAVLTTTYDGARDSDITALRNSGAFRGICDHMKACDGGMTFIMCRHGIRHILENHANVISRDNEFVCTDYFSLAAPFVNYKTGDTGSLGDTHLCKCGRYYRELKFSGRKSFTVRNNNGAMISSVALDDKIKKLGDIVQAVYKDGFIHIRSNKSIDQHAILPGFTVTTEIGNFKQVGRAGKIPRFVKW